MGYVNSKIDETECQKNGNKNNEKKNYYSVNGHRGTIIFWVIVAFIVCCLVFPWIIAVFNWIFKQWGWSLDSQNVLNLELIPDFLGGLCGVIIGFIIEGVLISKLKILTKYAGMIQPLCEELRSIKELLFDRKLNLFKKDYEMGKELFYNFYRWNIDDIATSLEKETIFFQLPAWFPFIPDKVGKTLSTHIHNINGIILKLNSYYGKIAESNYETEVINYYKKTILEEYIKLVEKINAILRITKSKLDNDDKKTVQKWLNDNKDKITVPKLVEDNEE